MISAKPFEKYLEPSNLKQALVGAERALIRQGGLFEFLRCAWPIAEGRPLIEGLHVRLICDRLERVTRGEIRQLVINIPPGHGKSTIAWLWQAWEWTQNPEIKHISTSYDLGIVLRDARALRRLVQSDWYRARWPLVRLARSRDRGDSAGVFGTTLGGLRFSSSVGSKGIGWHAHRHVVDDPHKPLAALATSGIALDEVATWFGSMASRGMPGFPFSRVVIMQRLARGDLSGRLLEQGGWHHLCLPLRGDPDHPYHCPDDYRAPGQLLCPELKSESEVRAEEIGLGPEQTEAQHQQLPAPPGGAIFHSDWLRHWAELPGWGVWIQSWDTTFGAVGTRSWVVGQLWLNVGDDYFLVDQVRDQVEYPVMRALILDFYARHPYVSEVLIESAAAGKPLAQDLESEIPGLREISVAGKGSKGVRAKAVTGLWAAGNVHLPQATGSLWNGKHHACPWVGGFVRNLLDFRGLATDVADEIDAMSMALTYLRGSTGGFVRAMTAARKNR